MLGFALSFYAHPFDAAEHEERGAAVLEAAALGERQRKTAVASAGEPTTAPSSRTSPLVPPRQPVATSGEPLRMPVTPEVAGSSPVAPVLTPWLQ
jgi:hypothetical protein